MDSPLPEQHEKAILSYLRDQEIAPAEDEFVKLDSQSEEFMRNYLDEVLLNVEKRTAWKERYLELKKEHNQYPLFDLMDLIPDFFCDENMIKSLAFYENLLIYNLDEKAETVKDMRAVGGFCLDVQWTDGKLGKHIKDCDLLEQEILESCKRVRQYAANVPEKKSDREAELNKQLNELEATLMRQMNFNYQKFLVHMNSHFDYGLKAGSNLTAWVDRDFHTVEEKRKEFVIDKDCTHHQKSLYVGMQEKKYYLHFEDTKEKIDVRKYYSFAKTRDFMGEAASVILMRFLAINRYIGVFELSTMFINGDMCRNIYECKGPTTTVINGNKVDAYKVYRTIIEECGLTHRACTLLTLYGRIITQEWEGCPYILNVNPKRRVENDKITLYQHLQLANDWGNDLQMLSKYLEKKTEAEQLVKTYLHDHPEINDAISDYMQHILLMKPDEVYGFTCEYFKRYLPLRVYERDFYECKAKGSEDEYDFLRI